MRHTNGTDTAICANGINMEIPYVSTLFVHAFSIHFYLRDKRAKRCTTILAVIRSNDKRIKLSLPIHVHPNSWDKRNERLYPTTYDAIAHNKQISDIRCYFENLCLSLYDIEKIRIRILDKFNMAYRNTKDINIRGILLDAFNLYYDEKKAKREVKQSTIDDRTKNLNTLCKIIEDMGVNNSREFLTRGYERLKEYVIDYYGGYSSAANQRCAQFAMLLNYIREKQKYLKYNIEPIKHEKFYSQKNHKTNLLDDEIEALETVQLDNEQENNVRYLFLIETECGSRNCDLTQIVNKIRGLNVGELKAYTETKENNTAIVLNTEKMRSYISQLTENHKKISTTYANRLLKQIAKKANLCRAIPSMGNKPLKDCISTHFGRHTFITNMRKKGYSPDEVIVFTGHATAEMVKNIYAHLTPEDKENEARHIISKHNNQQSQQSNSSHPQLNSLPNSIDEAKRVLNFLGVDADDYMEINNFDDLLRLVSLHEGEIIKGFDLDKILMIKEVFNQDADISTRKEHLHNLIGLWNNR